MAAKCASKVHGAVVAGASGQAKKAVKRVKVVEVGVGSDGKQRTESKTEDIEEGWELLSDEVV